MCGQLTVNNVCSSCTADPQKVAVMINSSIRSSEMSYQQLLLVSNNSTLVVYIIVNLVRYITRGIIWPNKIYGAKRQQRKVSR